MRISDWSSDVCSSDLLVIGPPASKGDAGGQEDPGGECPGPHPARPRGIRPPLDQPGNGEGEGHRETHIAGVEIGRASCRDRVCQFVEISVVAVSLQKTNKGVSISIRTKRSQNN